MDLRWMAVAALIFVGLGEGRALARRHAHRRAPVLATLVLTLELPPESASTAAAACPIWARPDLLFQDQALYPTPHTLGMMGFMVAMMALRMAHYSPNPTRPLLVPIPMFSSGAIGAALYGRFQ